MTLFAIILPQYLMFQILHSVYPIPSDFFLNFISVEAAQKLNQDYSLVVTVGDGP